MASHPTPEDFFQDTQGSIDEFKTTVAGQQDFFLDNQTIPGLQQDFRAMAEGRDPVIEAQRLRTLQEQQAQFQRRGVGGSALENQQLRTGTIFDERQQEGRVSALQNIAGLGGQQAGFKTQGLENAAAIPALDIGLLAALSAGGNDAFNRFFPAPPSERRRRSGGGGGGVGIDPEEAGN